MAKKADPRTAEFQPVAKALLRSVLDDDAAVAATAVVEPPASKEPKREEETVREREASRVVQMRSAPTAATEPRRTSDRRAPDALPVMGERLDKPVKVHLSPQERAELNRILNQISEDFGSTVAVSNILRALLSIFRHAEPQVLKRTGQNGHIRRPPNDDHAGIAAFEYRLAKILSSSFREAPPLQE